MKKVPSANIYSKTSGNLETRLPPWDYKRWGFEQTHSYFDGTTKRFNANSKMVVIEGPPALGKTEVAKAIVDDLAHIFNTGEGIVTERSPFSDWIYFDAAYRQ